MVWGAWVNLALATWTQQLKSPGFTAWRYQIDDALFGGSPPSVVRLGSTVPRDGVVGIDGQCAGLYIAEQGRWVALERSPARTVSGTFTPGADTTLLSGDAGTLTLSAVDDGVQVSWLPADGEPVDGPVLAWDGGPVEVTVVADPVVDGLLVIVDDQVGLVAGNPPELSTMQPGPSFVTKASTTPICDDLAGRLAPGLERAMRGEMPFHWDGSYPTSHRRDDDGNGGAGVDLAEQLGVARRGSRRHPDRRRRRRRAAAPAAPR